MNLDPLHLDHVGPGQPSASWLQGRPKDAGSTLLCIHSFWRASSTFFWQKLSGRRGLFAFYEPFHEELNARAPQLPSVAADAWRRQSNHPPVADYWQAYRNAEIRPCFLGQQYYGEFNTENYFLFSESKKRQISCLIDNALEHGASQVALCFTRSLGCGPAMRRYLSTIYPSLGQCHVILRRDPLAQFSSALRLLDGGNAIFIAYYLIAIAFSRPELFGYLGIDCGRIASTASFERGGHETMLLFRDLDGMGLLGQARIVGSALRAFLCCTMLQLSSENGHHDIWLDVSASRLAAGELDRLNAALGFVPDFQDFRVSDRPFIDQDLFRKTCRESHRVLIESGLIQDGQGMINHYYRDYL
ncbi:MAG: hypothetical protein ACKO0M_06300 [Cyanobium sp.]